MAKTKPDDDEDEVLLDAPPDASTDEAAASLAPAEDAARATEGAEAVEERKPLWQELELDEAYKDVEDPVEIARRLAADRKAAEERFTQRLVASQQDWERRTAELWQQHQLHAQQQSQQNANKAEPKKWWMSEGVQEEWFAKYVKTDPETGESKIVGAPPDVEKKMLEYAEERREHDRRFNYDRENYLREIISAAVPDIVRQQIEEIEAARIENEQVNEFERLNQGWLYEWYDDPQTGEKRLAQYIDPVTGKLRPQESWQGKQVIASAQQLAAGRRGMARLALDFAAKSLLGEHYLESQIAAQRAEENKKKSDQRKLDALDANGTRRKNRNGAEAKAETRDAPAQSNSSRALFTAMFDSLSSPDGTFDPLAV